MPYKDEDIIKGILEEGTHSKAFEEFYLAERKLIAYTSSMFSKLREEEREDAYTYAVLEVARKIVEGKYERTAKLKTFLSTIYRRRCGYLAKKKNINKGKPHFSTKWIDDLPNLTDKSKRIVEELQEVERDKVLFSKVAQLKEKCRQILNLFYFEGLSHQKIAEKTVYKDAASVKSKKYKCLQQLVKLFPENWDWRG